jgi:hypothetical protein
MTIHHVASEASFARKRMKKYFDLAKIYDTYQRIFGGVVVDKILIGELRIKN